MLAAIFLIDFSPLLFFIHDRMLPMNETLLHVHKSCDMSALPCGLTTTAFCSQCSSLLQVCTLLNTNRQVYFIYGSTCSCTTGQTQDWHIWTYFRIKRKYHTRPKPKLKLGENKTDEGVDGGNVLWYCQETCFVMVSEAVTKYIISSTRGCGDL